ncbi:uncharacterized protein RCC_02923 [Ramularia collo-cygni]|uniref:Uncharacterized protein n=1 Tax=Ramularia collo-cygni TaxID=112498 RepID=A0A2D3UP91_9PEZI|nr:uncharacterized protein RCC_02923 [Ramularia collo-cygni]CZT17091.1 uncharacterized protein RCC_02923 [Ramularia collo-cygni]
MGSSSKSGTQGSGFFKQFANPKSKSRETYYEDLYGTRNEEEESDQFPEACESESDSDEAGNESFRKSSDYKRFFDGSYSGSKNHPSKAAEPPSATIDERQTPCPQKRYKISPKENHSRSMELTSRESRFEDDDIEDNSEEKETPDTGDPHTTEVGRRRSKTSSRMLRPKSRRLFKQELAEQDKRTKESNAARKKLEREETAEARRKKKTLRRGIWSKESAKSKHITHKKAKLAEDLGGDDAGVKAYVLVDLTGVNVEEYERFPDG